ncbi:MAG: ABC transporter permease subunit [Anaerolineales bacterium]|nr:ABC transporter permease subunit [Anaerolineales bacterium]MCW5855486.1 ABC transporter permease subunit [Anaerolineales bacterium]
MKKIWIIIRKEWDEVFRNRIVLYTTIGVPLLFSAIPIGILSGLQGATDMSSLESELGMGMGAEMMAQLCGTLQGVDCGQYLLLQQFMILFLMMPAIIPVTIAAYSIVGEKNTRTLEPLLATPISTEELLAGKALAAVIPAVVGSFSSFFIFVAGANFLASPAVAAQLFSPLWLLGIFTVGPLLSLAGVSLAVMISSRVSEPRAAEQLTALLVLPITALFMGQLFGLLVVDQTFMLWVAAGLVLVDAALLFFAVQLFQRENILTRWK